jgi:hypothetical protein
MSKMTPEQEARYALGFNVARSGLSMAAQLEYDRLLREGYGEPQPIGHAAGTIRCRGLAIKRLRR